MPIALPCAPTEAHPVLVPDLDPAPLSVTGGRGVEPVEGEVLDPVDPHGLLGTTIDGHGGATLVGYSCRCGTWDAIVTGPSSAAWALRDHDRHRADHRADR